MPFLMPAESSGFWSVAIFHKQRQLIAGFQVAGIAVPAHHIANVHAMAFRNARQRVALTHAIGNAIAIVCQTFSAAACANHQILTDLQVRTANTVPLLDQCSGAVTV